MREDELERLVRLELGAVVHPDDRVTGYRVDVVCEGDEVVLRIEDPLTQKALERTLRARGGSPEPERLIALSVAQLYRASWLELIADETKQLHASKTPPEAPRTKEAVRASIEPLLPASKAVPSQVHVALGLAARGIGGSGVTMPAVAVGYGWRPAPPWRVGVGAQLEAGDEQRDTGRVEAKMASVHLRFSYDLVLADPVVGELSAQAGVAYTSLNGTDVGTGFLASRVRGMGLDGSVGAGVAVAGERAKLGLEARAGAVSHTPVGFVANDRSVDLNGAWVGGFAIAALSF